MAVNVCIEAAPSHKVAIEAHLVTIVVRTEAETAHIVGAIECMRPLEHAMTALEKRTKKEDNLLRMINREISGQNIFATLRT